MSDNKLYPLKFLDAYGAEDTEYFFGRTEEIEELAEACYVSPLVLLYGASGAGKTSLVQCGLAKKLPRQSWLDIYIRRDQDINHSLKESLKKRANLDKDKDYSIKRLIKSLYLKTFRPIYLIFDQFEELFLLGSQEEQAAFYQSVQELLQVKQEVKLIFSIREEFLGNLHAFEKAVPNLFNHRVRVEGMNMTKVTAVLEGINDLEGTVLTFEEEEEEAIAEALVAKLKGNRRTTSISLPYLQVILDKLYQQLSGDKEEVCINEEHVAGLADIDDILRDFLEERLQVISSTFAKEYKRDREEEQERLLTLLMALVSLEGTKIPRRAEELYAVLDLPNTYIKAALSALESNRILRYREEDDVYELAHDSLALSVADKRSDEEIEILEIRRYIKSQLSQEGSIRELISGKWLQRILPLEGKLALSREEVALVRASEEALAEEERRRRLWRNGIIAGTLLLIVVLSSLTVWALGASREAEASAKIAKNKEAEAIKAKNEALKSQEEALKSKQQAEVSKEVAEKKSAEALKSKQEAEASKEVAEKKSAEANKALLELAESNRLRQEEEQRSSIAKYNNYVERIKKELEVQLQVESYSYALAREYMTLAEELLKKNKDLDASQLESLESGLRSGELSEGKRKEILVAVEKLDWVKAKNLFVVYERIRKDLGGGLSNGEKSIKKEADMLGGIINNMVRVEGGEFDMGCTSEQQDCGDDEKPVHRVRLSTYAISKYECTQEQWAFLMEKNPRPSHFKGCGEDCPVEQVSWDDIQEFIKELNKRTGKEFRLPTEAEWEYAARGGKKSNKDYQFAGGNDIDKVARYDLSDDEGPSRVGAKLPNELGLYDMSGNVWEWCSDWYGSRYYTESPKENPQGPVDGSDRVRRGGSFRGGARYCSVAYRGSYSPGYRYDYDGFRLVLQLQQ